jgi:hypothetical protein
MGSFARMMGYLGVLLFIQPVLAQDAAQLEAAVAAHQCPDVKIGESGLPDYKSCKAFEPHWGKVDACQSEADHYWKLVQQSNKVYGECHQNDGKSAGAPPPSKGQPVQKSASAGQPNAGDLASRLQAQQKKNTTAEGDRIKQVDSFNKSVKAALPAPPSEDPYHPQKLTPEQDRQARIRSQDADEKAQREADAAKQRQAALDREAAARDKRMADGQLCFSGELHCNTVCREITGAGWNKINALPSPAPDWFENNRRCMDQCRQDRLSLHGCVEINPDYRAQVLSGLRRHQFDDMQLPSD